jgi:hypothetical protein
MNHEVTTAWQQRSGFSAFFESRTSDGGALEWRTRLYHDESGESCVIPGSASAEWLAWIEQRRLGISAAPDPSTVERAALPATDRSFGPTMTVQHVKVARRTPFGTEGALDVVVEVALRVVGGDQTRLELGAEVLAAALGSWERFE